MSPFNSTYLSNTAIFHFHEYTEYLQIFLNCFDMVSFPITEIDKMCFFMGRKSRVGAIFPDKSLARIQVTLRFTTPSAARAESVLLAVKQQGIQVT